MSSKCPSSKEALNGSALSNPRDRPRDRARADQRLVNGTHLPGQSYQNSANDHESQSDSYSQYPSAATYQSHPGGPSQFQPYPHDNTHVFQSYTPQPARYASQISLEGEQNATSSGANQTRSQTSQYFAVSHSTAPEGHSYQPQTTASVPATAATSSTAPETTTQRWSDQHYSHEPMLLSVGGLTGEQVRQARHASAVAAIRSFESHEQERQADAAATRRPH